MFTLQQRRIPYSYTYNIFVYTSDRPEMMLALCYFQANDAVRRRDTNLCCQLSTIAGQWKTRSTFERKMADGRRCCVSVCSWFQAASDMPVDPPFRQKHAPLSTILQTTSMLLSTKNLIHACYGWACTNGADKQWTCLASQVWKEAFSNKVDWPARPWAWMRCEWESRKCAKTAAFRLLLLTRL